MTQTAGNSAEMLRPLELPGNVTVCRENSLPGIVTGGAKTETVLGVSRY